MDFWQKIDDNYEQSPLSVEGCSLEWGSTESEVLTVSMQGSFITRFSPTLEGSSEKYKNLYISRLVIYTFNSR